MNAPAPSHVPVLAGPIQAAAAGARRMVDGTLGHGGHAALFVAMGAEVLGIDRDPEALAIARHRLDGAPVTFLAGSFGDAAVHQAIIDFRPDLILLDLGVSSRQLDDDPRGFTFRPGAPLDMRMDQAGSTAADLLNAADEVELTAIFRDFGDERRARALAREVVRRRVRAPFAVSDDLVNAIRAVLGPQSGAADFARLFQAIRIAVNGELEALERSLPVFRDALTPGGTLAVISYHSGEDRIAKRYFHEWARACICPPEQPVCTCRGRPLGAAEPRRAITADPAEVEANPRSRSARLRIFRKAA
ncbi:MAG: 16S rRNA (cytosine(1402)-N(4))-methyltransferase RsmH [Gemmatimonadales bacterium]